MDFPNAPRIYFEAKIKNDLINDFKCMKQNLDNFVINNCCIFYFFFRFGRKPSLCLSVTIMFGSNLGLVFAPNYIAFVVLRFFAGMGNVGCFGQSFIIGKD